MQRTYSRKGRRTISKSADGSRESSPEHAQTNQQRKRRKIQVEVVSAESSTASVPTKIRRSSSKPESLRQTASTSSNGSQLVAPSPLRRVASEHGSHKKGGSSFLEPSTTEDPLAVLFGSADTPHRPSPSPQKTGGIVKNMLRRTRTESSIMGSTPTTHAGDSLKGPASGSSSPRKLGFARTESIIDLTLDSPSVRSPSKSTPQSQEDILSSSPGKPARPPLAPTSVRTYAGKARSFLVPLPNPTVSLDSQTDFNETQEDDLETSRESYADLRMRWGVDNSEDDPYAGMRAAELNPNRVDGELPAGIMNDLKSISELRSKGESRRFLDEVGYLFEGLDPSGAVGVRRGSAMEIVTKLCDEDFARRARATDYLGKTWDMLRGAGAGDGDKVLDNTLGFFAALAARNQVDLVDLSSKPDFADALFRMLGKLDRSTDALWLISCGMSDPVLKRAGISKVEKTALMELHRMVRKKGGIFPENEIISNRLLLSHTLALLPSSILIPSENLPTLISTLGSELAPLPDRVSAYASGLALIPELDASTHTEVISLGYVDNCLRLLDGSLLRREADRDEDINILQMRKDLPTLLVSLCVATDVLSRTEADMSRMSSAARCLESTLRVLINVTHDNRDWCEGILGDKLTLPMIVRLIVTSQWERLLRAHPKANEESNTKSEGDAEQERAASLLDRLCLALGLLTNLVQVAEEVKDLIYYIALDPSCPGTHKCIVNCRCASPLPALSCLARVYSQQDASNNDLDSVVQGHLAILLGLLMQRRPRNQVALLDVLPGSSKRDRLLELINKAKDFMGFYVHFTNKVAESQRDDVDYEDMVVDEGANDRGDVRGNVGQVLRDTKGEMVAKDVITFLESLQSSAYD